MLVLAGLLSLWCHRAIQLNIPVFRRAALSAHLPVVRPRASSGCCQCVPGLPASLPMRWGSDTSLCDRGSGHPERQFGLSGGNGRSVGPDSSEGGCRAVCWSRWHQWPQLEALTCPEAVPASLPTPQAFIRQEPARLCPSLGIVPAISWELWEEGDSVDPCRIWAPSPFVLGLRGAGGALDQTHHPPHCPAGGFGHGAGTGHV